MQKLRLIFNLLVIVAFANKCYSHNTLLSQVIDIKSSSEEKMMKETFGSLFCDENNYVIDENLLKWNIFVDFGDVKSADIEAKTFFNRHDNMSPLQLAWGMYNMGVQQILMKDYAIALSAFKECNKVLSLMQNSDRQKCMTLNCIATAYCYLGEFGTAKWYVDEASELIGSENICDSVLTFSTLINKAYILYRLGNYNEAEQLYKRIIKSHPGLDILTRNAYNNLFLLYFAQKRFSECMSICDKIDSASAMKKIPYEIPLNQTLFYSITKQSEKAKEKLQYLNSISKDDIIDHFLNFPINMVESYWAQISDGLILANNLSAFETLDSEIVENAYENQIFYSYYYRGFFQLINAIIRDSDDKELHDKFLQYKYFQDAAKHKTHNDSINYEYESNKLYREMLSCIKDYLEQKLSNKILFHDIQNCLEDNEIILEICDVAQLDSFPKRKNYYGVYIIKKDYKHPKILLIEEMNKIDSMFIDSDVLGINELYKSDGASPKLYSAIWAKLEPHLEKIETIYYSPCGNLLNLNFDMLCDEYGRYLGDKYNLVRLSSTGLVPEYKKQSNTYSSSVLFGDIKYDANPQEMEEQSKNYKSFSGENISENLTLRSLNDRGRWGILPYTKLEIESISKALCPNGIVVTIYQDINANEEAFKALDGNSPDIIHMATHGFVIDTQNKAKGNRFAENISFYSNREGYLSWCGLMLAGSNNAWTGNFNLENVEDGILTADEISRLDLSNTKLVVLSACETARGKIDPVEGVLGLQRAFKKAGAQTIVMSLWKVPDESTSILMTQFYKGLMEGTERHKALKDAMNYVKTLYPDPYYWAGFIMLD